ncbi:VOC family protein [Pseudoxanthomonas winnipegensis]|uniref:Glyoxalase/bleomycin resistance/extradiol dioxygenase family protein n=1 Tax=Pseudoxanthomonas winnipegensis TaxID=2480810 RepID=A0A4Q8M0D7_9GAMM|nr:glyoxalase superfamily protein [Pseudoxanthomonas winnipegensis]RZZ90334.1 glyoxalase/bleomycin resistance/extradiol dioxygenase family protein [Pseudoxanthomonas winnipegensis]TAA37509.1 glyoxalase/bleomycin resistance/extradiol dioxygenase family protein [Pseudoxanthomonas winnipegensis]
MPLLDTYRKQAKQLVRWHRAHNLSIGGRVRLLPRFAGHSDAEILAMPMPLALAQEVVAAEAGFDSWAALKASSTLNKDADPTAAVDQTPRVRGVVPILFVRDVADAARFYQQQLGFAIGFLHGHPPFYGAVSRNGACVHLRFVHAPNFSALAETEPSLILASFEVSDVKALHTELVQRGAPITQPLTRQAWGGLDFQIRDPDGNAMSFVQYRT